MAERLRTYDKEYFYNYVRYKRCCSCNFDLAGIDYCELKCAIRSLSRELYKCDPKVT